MRVLIDLDEVLTDFVGGALAAWGTSREEVLNYWSAGDWHILPPLNAALGRGDHPLPPPLTTDQFWARLAGPEFWQGLQPLPWLDDLLALVEQYDKHWIIVSAPSLDPSSHLGKVLWLKNRFGKGFDRFCVMPHKELFARSGTVLIDDRDSNVAKFAAAGGKGIIFPAHHNSQHRVANGAAWLFRIPPQLEFVKRRLEDLAQQLEQTKPLPPVPMEVYSLCPVCIAAPCEC